MCNELLRAFEHPSLNTAKLPVNISFKFLAMFCEMLRAFKQCLKNVLKVRQ